MGAPATVAEMLVQLDLRDPGEAVGRPRVVLNMIASADGRAALEGRSGGLSSSADRDLLRGLREGVDAVLVGAGTARVERYGRILRDAAARARRTAAGLAPEPLACIVSAGLALADLPLLASTEARVAILTAAAGEVTVGASGATSAGGSSGTTAAGGASGAAGAGPATVAATVSYVRTVQGVQLDLAAALGVLRRDYGVATLVCEGGPSLAGELVQLGLVDELLLTVAPAIVGGRDPLTIIATDETCGPAWLELVYASPIGSHVFLRYRRSVPAPGAPAQAVPPGTAP